MSSKNKDKNNKKQKLYITIGAIVAMVLVVVSALLIIKNNEKSKQNEIAYTELIKEINDGTVEKIEMTVGSTNVKVKLRDIEEEKKAIIPSTQPFVELIQEKVESGNNIELIQNKTNIFISIGKSLFSLLPTIMLVVLFIAIFKIQGLGDKGKVYDAETKNINIPKTSKEILRNGCKGS